MSATDWSGFQEWHQLLDALCRRGVHQGDDALASEFCTRSGRTTQADFEAARKRIRAWRNGRNLPLRRNAALLGSMLGVDDDPALARAWVELYRRAQPVSSAQPSQTGPAPPSLRTSLSKSTLAAALGLCMLALAILLSIKSDHRVASELPIVNFEGRVRVPQGASVLVHGHPGACDGVPPPWVEMEINIPSSGLGEFSDGGLARKVVRKCLGERLVRSVKFTAATAGIEVVSLFGDRISFEVISQNSSP